MQTALKDYLLYPALILLVLAIPLLLVSLAVNIYTGSEELYTGGFARYHISDATGIRDSQLQNVARGMVGYLNGKVPSPQVEVDTGGIRRPVYNQKELIHMEDVRKIIEIFKILEILSLIIILVTGCYIFLRAGMNRLLGGLQAGAVVTVAFLGAVMLWALIDFNSIFYFFHILSFSNDLWLLDPATDYLIMMFPEGFFFDTAVLIVATIITAALVTWIAAYVAKKVLQRAEKTSTGVRSPV
jgi:integral membrane protein (TIGR01906 family)